MMALGGSVTEHERLMTARELAAYLKISIQTVYNWKTTGLGPRRRKAGGSVRFAESDVVAWMNREEE